jgi:hypothetical protein
MRIYDILYLTEFQPHLHCNPARRLYNIETVLAGQSLTLVRAGDARDRQLCPREVRGAPLGHYRGLGQHKTSISPSNL